MIISSIFSNSFFPQICVQQTPILWSAFNLFEYFRGSLLIYRFYLVDWKPGMGLGSNLGPGQLILRAWSVNREEFRVWAQGAVSGPRKADLNEQS